MGATLTASPGTWTSSPTPAFTYRWRRCDAAGASCSDLSVTSSTYQPVAGDAGGTLRVGITATTAHGSTGPVY